MFWSFTQIWNESLEQGKPERELKARQKIWASEMGGAFIDRFLKMKGVPPTNPPNARSLRKFEAGNTMEWLVILILKRAGILQETQRWVSYQYPKLLQVTGKLDCLAGGIQKDWRLVEEEIAKLELPEFFGRATMKIIEHFQKEYPKGLKTVILEVKSCSSFMYERYEKYGLESSKNHVMQAYHYLKAANMPEAHLVYICKDDLRMLEFGIFNPSKYEEWYKSDIETMTEYIKSDTEPSKEQEIIYNPDTCKFSTNWKVEYSNFLSMLYGYKEPINYREKWDKIIASWNRTLGRCIAEKNMTALNLEVLQEIKKRFPNFDALISEAKKKGIKEELEDETTQANSNGI